MGLFFYVKFFYMKKHAFLLLLLGTSTIFSCKKDKNSKLTPQCDGSHPTYNSGIKSIIDSNCNSSGCHNSGSSNGSFTTYSGLTGVINNGSFKRTVLTDQTMPQGSATLSQSNINKIQCWVNDGFPEN